MVADKHWHLQIRHYAANTLFASLKFIHSNLQLDDLADPFSIGNTCAKHFKTDRGSVVSFWMTYKNDVLVGIKRKRCNVQESISRDFKGGLAILMWLYWAYYDKWITLAWHSPNNATQQQGAINKKKEQASQQPTQAHHTTSSANGRKASNNKAVRKQPLTAIMLLLHQFYQSSHCFILASLCLIRALFYLSGWISCLSKSDIQQNVIIYSIPKV